MKKERAEKRSRQNFNPKTLHDMTGGDDHDDDHDDDPVSGDHHDVHDYDSGDDHNGCGDQGHDHNQDDFDKWWLYLLMLLGAPSSMNKNLHIDNASK